MAGIPSIPSIPGIPSIGGGAAPSRMNIFLSALYNVSPGNLRALWFPLATDTTTTTTVFDGRVWTWDATIAARITPQGNGVLVTFNGSSNSAQTPDTANISFGNGTEDDPFSWVALIAPDDTAATKTVFSKGALAGSTGEYGVQVLSNEVVVFRLIDASASASVTKNANVALTPDTLALIGGTYSGVGGASAANGMTNYKNGAVAASTNGSSGTYVAMEDTAANLRLGEDLGTRFFAGDMGFLALWGAELSAAQMGVINRATEYFYGVTLA